MADFHIAFDEGDADLGQYFNDSRADIVTFIQNHHHSHRIREIPSARCNAAYIDMFFPTLGGANFLFLAYSHGNERCLTSNGGWYVDSPNNTYHFVNAFFYSMACDTGRVMGPELISRGCLAFIGYKDSAMALLGALQTVSIDCDNRGIKNFISGMTLGESVDEMKLFFRQEISRLTKNGDVLAAGYLRHNLACLVVEGDRALTFGRFN